jgi:hypothetical protein
MPSSLKSIVVCVGTTAAVARSPYMPETSVLIRLQEMTVHCYGSPES